MAGDERVHCYCALCRSHCGAIAVVRDGRFVELRPDPEHPSGGALCPKGVAAPELVYHPKRLRYPLRRTTPKSDADPHWERISWNEALEVTTARLLELRATYGAESVAFNRPTASATASHDFGQYLERLVWLFGSPNMLNGSYLCQWGRDYGTAHTTGSGLPSPHYEEAGSILVWGHNPAVSWLNNFRRLRAAKLRGAKVVVVDVRGTETARIADLHLQPRPGTDGALALGLIREVIATGRYDEAFVRDWTNAPFLVTPPPSPLSASGRGSWSDGGIAGRRETALGANGVPKGERLELIRSETGRYAAISAATGERIWIDPTVPPSEWPDQPALSTTGCDAVSRAPGGRGQTQGLPLPNDPSSRRPVTLSPRHPHTLTPLHSHTVWEALWSRVAPYTPERVAELTGVAAELVPRAVALLYESRPFCYHSWNGVEQHGDVAQTNRALSILVALAGDLEARGGNVAFGKPPTGAIDPRSLLPKEVHARRLGRERRPLGGPKDYVMPPDLYRAILTSEPYPVRGLVSFGGNLLLQNPDTRLGERALRALDFYLHVDLFENPMARCADVLLPAQSCFEAPALNTRFTAGPVATRHLQYRPPIAAAPGESRSDLDIVFDLAVRLGYGDRFWDGSLERAFEVQLAPSGVTLADLRANPRGITLDAATTYRRYAEVDAGRVRGFGTPSGKVELFSETFRRAGHDPLPTYTGRAAPCTPDFPLTLTSAKVRAYCHSQHRNLPLLRRLEPHPYVEVHPETGRELAVRDGDRVRIVTPEGAIELAVKLSDRVPAGVAATQTGWWDACEELGLPGYDHLSTAGANVNLIIGYEVDDPISGSVPTKAYPCRIERIEVAARS